MSKRDSIRMSDAEVRDFLRSHRKLQLATIGSEGSPHLVTMFYGLLEGQVAFWTYRRSQKAVNLRRDPRLTVLIEDGDDYDDLRGVMLRGVARLIDDPAEVERLGLTIAGHQRELDEVTRQTVLAQAPKRMVAVVTDATTISWDHRKLATP